MRSVLLRFTPPTLDVAHSTIVHVAAEETVMPQIAWKPAQYHSLTPYLAVRGASKAIEFYKKAFGAEELYRMAAPDGTVMHAELRIGDAVLMLGEESPEMGAPSPVTLGGAPSGLLIYVEHCDQAFARALQAGATSQQPPTDMFWGDRYGQLKDPFGHRWSIATHTRDVSPDEMARAQAAWLKESAAPKMTESATPDSPRKST